MLFILLSLGVLTPTFAHDSFVDLINEETGPGALSLPEEIIISSLLGKRALDPLGKEFFVRAYLIKEKMATLEELPQVDPTQVEDIQKITLEEKLRGKENHEMMKAQYRGRSVMVKIKSRKISIERFVQENQTLLLLNQLNLGAEYFGVFHTSVGPAIVMEEIPGQALRAQDKKRDFRKVRPVQYLTEVAEMIVTLIKAGIHPFDVQFIWGDDGHVHLIDTGRFIAFGVTVVDPRVPEHEFYKARLKLGYLADSIEVEVKTSFDLNELECLLFEETLNSILRRENISKEWSFAGHFHDLPFRSAQSYRERLHSLKTR